MAKEYPIAFDDEGGVQVSHIPTAEEKKNCGFAEMAGVECPEINFVFGAPRMRGCGSCFHHPHRKAVKGMCIKAS